MDTLRKQTAGLHSLINGPKGQLALDAKLSAAQSALANAKQQRSSDFYSYRDQARGTFNIGSTGYTDAGTIESAMKNKVAGLQQFTKDLATAKRKGVPADLINDLCKAGPDAGAVSAHTLANLSMRDLKEIRSLDKQLDTASNRVGAAAAHSLDDAGVAAA